jgi:hypothetical protein
MISLKNGMPKIQYGKEWRNRNDYDYYDYSCNSMILIFRLIINRKIKESDQVVCTTGAMTGYA